MSANLYTNRLITMSTVVAIFLMQVSLKSQTLKRPESTRFERVSHKIVAGSPRGSAAIVMLPARDEKRDPELEGISANRHIALGPLRRSAHVFWNPQGSIAILWDLAYSNNYFVRAIKTTPAIHEVKGFDEIIRDRVNAKFHSAQTIHYWPWVLGWNQKGELAVVVCADGAHSLSPADTKVITFARGYELDVSNQTVSRELLPEEYKKDFGSNPCE